MKSWLSLLIFVACVGTVFAQDEPATMIGGTHYTGYSIDDLDTISMINGNLMVHIPIYSLKQKGNLPLTFSISGNNLSFSETASCSWYDNQPCAQINRAYGWGVGCTYGIGFHSDQTLRVCRMANPQDVYQGDVNIGRAIYPSFSVISGEKDSHPLWRDNNYLNHLYSTDGSGFRMDADSSLFTDVNDSSTPTAPNSDFDLYSNKGTKSHFTNVPIASYTTRMEVQRTDSNGNSIQRGHLGSDPQRFYYQDSLGRIFTDGPFESAAQIGTSTSVSGCPSTAALYQDATYSYIWTVPTVNGSENYLFCYTTVLVRTNRYGFGPGQGTAIYGPGGGYELEYDFDTTSPIDVVQSVVLPDGTSWKFEYDAANPAYNNSTNPNAPKPEGYGDLLKIITPQGGSISYTYDFYQNSAYYNTPWPAQFRGVATRTVNDGLGSSKTWEYHIGETMSYGSGSARRTRVVNPLEAGGTSANETIHIYGYPSGAQSNEPSVEIEKRTYQGSVDAGTLLESVSSSYQAITEPIFYKYPAENLSMLPTSTSTTRQGITSSTNNSAYDGGFTATQTWCSKSYQLTDPHYLQWSCGTSTTKSASFGLPKSIHYSNYSGYPDKIDQTGYKWESDSSYYSANLLSAISTKTATDGTDSTTMTYGYDDNTNGSPAGAHGNVTSVSKSGTLGGSVSTSTVYDSSGRPTQSFDGRNNKTEYEYTDAASGLVTKIKRPTTNGIQHNDSYTYSSYNGQILSHTDENGNVSHYEYNDPLGRVTKIRVATANGESTKTVDYSVARVYTVKQDKDHTGDGLISTSTTVDGLGRSIKTVGPDGSIVDTIYDASGAVHSKSNPHFSTTSPSDGVTTFTYDALGRKTSQEHPGAVAAETEHWSYSGNTTDYSIGSTRRWQQKADAFGQLTDVYEDPDGANLHTNYIYDFLGNLKTVDQQGRMRSFTYDSLSRLIQAYNPETRWLCYGTTGGAVPDGTNCTAGYDGNGNLEHKTDARAVTVNYVYDELNRLKTKTFSGTATNTPSTCYQYDTTAAGYANGNFSGRMTHEWTQNGDCSASLPSSGVVTRRSVKLYDPVGNVRVEERCALNNCSSSTFTPFSLHFSFDLANNLTDYDNGLGNLNLSNYYDTAGRLYKVGSSAYDATHPNSLYNVESFLPSGTPNSFNYGLYLHGTQSMDNRLRPQQLIVTGK